MSILIENNLHVIRVIKAIEKKALAHSALEGDVESNKVIFMDMIENTVRIIQYLERVRDQNFVQAKEICLEQMVLLI